MGEAEAVPSATGVAGHLKSHPMETRNPYSNANSQNTRRVMSANGWPVEVIRMIGPAQIEK
jgi:hypothetical protein